MSMSSRYTIALRAGLLAAAGESTPDSTPPETPAAPLT